MDNWFTIDEIDQDTFAIGEYQHWEETHCYLLCGTQKALLIDTGLGVANIKTVVDALTTLPIEVATTHVHWDHIGGHHFFDDIAVHEIEASWLTGSFPLPLQVVKNNLMLKPCNFPKSFDLNNYQIYQGTPSKILRDGDCLSLGSRTIQVLHTPGHSPGHCCFYESERQYLFSGDLIYKGCLDAFYPSTDPQLFWQSVKRVQSLAVSRILPGHHSLIVPTNIVNMIESAFHDISNMGCLKQGGGIFDYGDFQIHI